MMQWCTDLKALFDECHRVLKPQGLILFTTFGPETLKELKRSWSVVDNEAHVNEFVDMHDIGDALMRNGLTSPILNAEEIVLTYQECKQLMRELKYIGARNINSGRRKTLTGKKRIEKVFEYYETYRVNNKLPVTYEVIYGHAWQPVSKKNVRNKK